MEPVDWSICHEIGTIKSNSMQLGPPYNPLEQPSLLDDPTCAYYHGTCIAKNNTSNYSPPPLKLSRIFNHLPPSLPYAISSQPSHNIHILYIDWLCVWCTLSCLLIIWFWRAYNKVVRVSVFTHRHRCAGCFHTAVGKKKYKNNNANEGLWILRRRHNLGILLFEMFVNSLTG